MQQLSNMPDILLCRCFSIHCKCNYEEYKFFFPGEIFFLRAKKSTVRMIMLSTGIPAMRSAEIIVYVIAIKMVSFRRADQDNERLGA